MDLGHSTRFRGLVSPKEESVHAQPNQARWALGTGRCQWPKKGQVWGTEQGPGGPASAPKLVMEETNHAQAEGIEGHRSGHGGPSSSLSLVLSHAAGTEKEVWGKN